MSDIVAHDIIGNIIFVPFGGRMLNWYYALSTGTMSLMTFWKMSSIIDL
ncbi:MAG: hypothetical protein NC393_09405 [Clostridium sp.]|nr:hypothetical protein [Clostridium sp.]MCM1172328.1 hypothetical protein [Clostridium sp.]MCM1208190.1 hypothetical protein [Ruminococcus sp.]